MSLSLHPDVHPAPGADPPGCPGWVRAAAGRRWGGEGRMSSLVAARGSAGMSHGLSLFPVCHWSVWCFCTGLMEAFTKFRFLAALPKQSMLTWRAGQSPLCLCLPFPFQLCKGAVFQYLLMPGPKGLTYFGRSHHPKVCYTEQSVLHLGVSCCQAGASLTRSLGADCFGCRSVRAR